MINHNFYVGDTEFTLDLFHLTDDNFVVKSVLGEYKVIFEQTGVIETVNKIFNNKNIMLLDNKIKQLYDFNNFDKERILLADVSEEYKNIDSVMTNINFLMHKKFTQTETLIIVGGGIIQDVGGFTAACFKRGICWKIIPTTLLAMSDSCIGGKTAINYGNVKNQIGFFSIPEEVLININFLKTLSLKDIKSGMGEILKTCIIGGIKTLELYTQLVVNGVPKNFSNFITLIKLSLMVKKIIIEVDEFENNERKVLNYGHTLGHVIEIISNYKISHGQSVAFGIILANNLALKYNIITNELCQNLNNLAYELLDEDIFYELKEIDFAQVNNLLFLDKKTEGIKIIFVLIKELGRTIFKDIAIDDIDFDNYLCFSFNNLASSFKSWAKS